MRPAIALIGDPVHQSVSPAMHTAAIRAAGLDLDYVAVRVRLGELEGSFPELRRRFSGFNVTIPLKEALIPLLDAVSPLAARAGSVNTVVVKKRAVGHTTDGPGFLAAMRRMGVGSVGHAVILGTGGAARAVAAALADAGVRVTLWGRNERAGSRIAADLPVSFTSGSADALRSIVPGSDLLVNATPVGGREDEDEDPVPPGIELDPATTVFDLVYRPMRTRLLRRAAAAGCRTIPGIEMLIEQGARSFELWTGVDAPVTAMRTAAFGALGESQPEPGVVVAPGEAS